MNITILAQTFLFYLMPLVIGRAILVGLDRKRRAIVYSPADWTRIPVYFGLGTLFLFAWALLCWYGFHSVFGWRFEHIYFVSVWIIALLSVAMNIWQRPRQLMRVIIKGGLPVLGVLVAAVISFGIWTHNSTYPLNWDWYQHQTLSGIIQGGQFSFVTSELSDTFGFNSYPPMFHVLLAVAQYPASLTPDYVISFWQYISYLHVVTVGLVSLLLGWRVTHEKWLAGLMAILGIFIFDSMVSLTTFALLPQTLAAGLGTGLLAFLVFPGKLGQRLTGWATIAALGLPLMHYMVGGGMAILILALMAFQTLNRRWLMRVVVGVIMALMVGAVLFAPLLKLNFLNQGEAGSFRFSLEAKREGLERSYGYLIYLLVPMGIMYAWTEKHRRTQLGIAAFILFGCVLVLVTDIPYVLKFYTIARYWVHLFMALGVWLVMRSMQNNLSRVVAGLGISVLLLALLTVNVATWKAGLLYRGNYTHIAPDDMRAAHLLHAVSDERVLVFSDPSTQFILEGLAGVDSVGGAYMKVGNRQLLSATLASGSAEQLVTLTRTISDGVTGEFNKRYLALSGRTFNWETVEEKDRWSFGYNTWAPVDISARDNTFIDSVLTVPGTKAVFRSAYMTLIEVN